jgi:hypothetical protein
MDYPYVQMIISLDKADVPEGLHEAVHEFRNKHAEWNHSNSACGHLGQGWFILYDFPPAERWARECSWKPSVTVCEDTSYTLIHFTDPKGEVEMKLRWHRT